MSGKDLLAVLAMIVPTLILIAAIALGFGLSGTEKADEGQDASIRAKPQAVPQCDPEKIERDGRCLYW